MTRFLHVVTLLFLSVCTHGQMVHDTVIFVEGNAFGVKIEKLKDKEEDGLLKIISPKGDPIISDSVKISQNCYLKQQDCNNDHILDLILYFSRDWNEITELYTYNNNLNFFQRIKLPKFITTENRIALHSIKGQNNIFYRFISLGFCLETEKYHSGKNAYSAIVLSLDEKDIIKPLFEISDMVCENNSKVSLYKYINGKRKFINKIQGDFLDDSLKLIFSRQQIEEFTRK